MADPISWAFIAVVGGSLLSGGYNSKEACYGHRDVLQEQKIYGQCVEVIDNTPRYGSTGSTITPFMGTNIIQGNKNCTIIKDQMICE